MPITLATIVDGINIRKEILNASNQQIADASGVSKSTVDRILRKQEGYTPSLQNLLDIANTVGYDFGQQEKTPIEVDDAILQQIIYVYEKRCADLERESRLKTVQTNMIIAGKDRWIRFLTLLSITFVVGIFTILVFDITNPFVGWFQR